MKKNAFVPTILALTLFVGLHPGNNNNASILATSTTAPIVQNGLIKNGDLIFQTSLSEQRNFTSGNF